MFCPENYVPLSRLDWRMKMEFLEATFASLREWYYRDDVSATLLSMLTVQDFAEFRFLDSVENHTYVCSPTGQVLAFDLRALRSRTEYWDPSYSQVTAAVKASQGPPIPLHFDRLFNLTLETHEDVSTWTNNDEQTLQQQADETGYDYFHQQLPMFYERWGWTISLAAYDYIKLAVDQGAKVPRLVMDEFVDVERLLRPFEGWSLCVPKQFAENEWAKRLMEERGGGTNRPSTSSGRPPTVRHDTLMAYRVLFPRGHAGTSWNSAIEQINKMTGHHASVDTLRRALAGAAPIIAKSQAEATA